ncbi:MAG TPA: hypothetical protein VL475_01335, partial [Planctomycetaceae bacterium]|nr:hypothetical protein [Planctomycetaceae bacterium]
MSLFGIRRGRNSRGAILRIESGPIADLRTILANRSVLSRVGLGFLTVTALLVCVQGWKQAFPYRLDQRPAAGVAAVVDFQRINRERTARARDRAAEQVPHVFRRDDRSLARLPQELRVGLLSFVQAGELGMLPAETRRVFGLAAEGALPPGGGIPVGDRAEVFQRLRQLAANEQQLKDVTADFTKFIQPLEENGLLRPEHQPSDLAPGGLIAVRDADGELRPISLAEVQ